MADDESGRVHALINLYNDRTFLSSCLESLSDRVDRIVIADGAYQLYYDNYKKYYPLAQPWSSDGSLEIALAFSNLLEPFADLEVLRKPEGTCWTSQAEKRTALVDAVPVGDWFLIIDADEMIVGDFEEGMEEIYESGCIVARVPLYNAGADIDRFQRFWHPRIYQKTQGMHYRGTHWHLRDGFSRIIESRYPIYWLDRFVFIHLKAFKRASRVIPHEEYMQLLAGRGWMEPVREEVSDNE